MIRTVTLHGPLAAAFGAGPYRFRCDNFRQLYAALTSLHPTFKRELMKHQDIAIMKIDGDRVAYVHEEELGFGFGSYPELHVGVGVRGSAAGGAAAVAGYFAAAGTAAYAAIYAVVYIAISVAVAYAISAVMVSLADNPNTEEAQSRRDDRSALFNGPDNKQTQGGRGQLIYGRFLVGSYTISQALEARRQPIGMANSMALDPNETQVLNIFANDANATGAVVSTFNVGGTGPTDAGDTFNAGVYSVSVSADGIMTVIAGQNGFDTDVLVTVTASNEGVVFLQNISIRIRRWYAPYENSGDSSSGNGSSGAGGGGSSGAGGDSSGGSSGGGDSGGTGP